LTDFFLPPDLRLAKATLSLDANTAAFSSPTVGSTRSVERLGDRLRINFDFTAHRDDPTTARQRGRMQAFLSQLRGQAGRVWMPPPGYALGARGSFPDNELLPNPTFNIGTAGISAFSSVSLAVSGRILRATSTAGTPQRPAFYQQGTVTPNTPYVARGFVSAASGITPAFQISDGTTSIQTTAAAGLYTCQLTPAGATTVTVEFYNSSVIGSMSGSLVDVGLMSLSQCALVDNAPNLLIQSETISAAAWTKSNATVATNSATAPDGTVTADGLQETAVTAIHEVKSVSNFSITSSIADYCLTSILKAGTRGWVELLLLEDLGGGSLGAYFDLSTGNIGSIFAITNWINPRVFTTSLGNGWWRCSVVGQKTNAAVSLTVRIIAATGNGGNNYLGVTGSDAIEIWRTCVAQSSVPMQSSQTVNTPFAGNSQTGTQIALKGLPASSSGLLLPGDWVQCNGQLNQVTASLDSDSAGLGVVQLARPFRNAPADGAPFIVNNPMGKFMVNSNSTAWNEQPGGLSDATVEFVEDISF